MTEPQMQGFEVLDGDPNRAEPSRSWNELVASVGLSKRMVR
jgi:hypothetical protein